MFLLSTPDEVKHKPTSINITKGILMITQNKVNTYRNAEEIIKRIEIMTDIVNSGVQCTHTKSSDFWFNSDWNSVSDSVQQAAKAQAKKELEKLKNELAVFLATV